VSFASVLIQLLNGWPPLSLFLVSAGLSLIFGVTRIVNFAHGSLTCWASMALQPDELLAHAHGLLGCVCWRRWRSVSRRRDRGAGAAANLSRAELFQLLATFAICW